MCDSCRNRIKDVFAKLDANDGDILREYLTRIETEIREEFETAAEHEEENWKADKDELVTLVEGLAEGLEEAELEASTTVEELPLKLLAWTRASDAMHEIRRKLELTP